MKKDEKKKATQVGEEGLKSGQVYGNQEEAYWWIFFRSPMKDTLHNIESNKIIQLTIEWWSKKERGRGIVFSLSQLLHILDQFNWLMLRCALVMMCLCV